MRSSAPTEVSAESFGGAAPFTTKLVPGSVWNAASSAGLLIQSCAKASRARRISGVLPSLDSVSAIFRHARRFLRRSRSMGQAASSGMRAESGRGISSTFVRK